MNIYAKLFKIFKKDIKVKGDQYVERNVTNRNK